MPIILRKFQTFPVMQPDNSFIMQPFATIAFVDPDGQQYAQLNVHADEVTGYEEGDRLVLSLGESHGLELPDHHAEMILAPSKVEAL